MKGEETVVSCVLVVISRGATGSRPSSGPIRRYSPYHLKPKSAFSKCNLMGDLRRATSEFPLFKSRPLFGILRFCITSQYILYSSVLLAKVKPLFTVLLRKLTVYPRYGQYNNFTNQNNLTTPTWHYEINQIREAETIFRPYSTIV